MLQRFAQYFFKFLVALNFYRGPRPFALALGFACFLGLLYGENPVLVLLALAVACTLQMNHLLMLVSSVAFAALGLVFYTWQLSIGLFLVEGPVFLYLFRFLSNVPLLPWLRLDRASNLGALILGTVTGSFLSVFSYRVLLIFSKRTVKSNAPSPKKSLSHHLKFLEGHLPKVSSILHNKKFEEWKAEYDKASEALKLAQQIQEEIRERELTRPDLY